MVNHPNIPRPPLSDFVEVFWQYDGLDPSHARESCLPTDTMEIVVNLRDDEMRAYDRRSAETPRPARLWRAFGVLRYRPHRPSFDDRSAFQAGRRLPVPRTCRGVAGRPRPPRVVVGSKGREAPRSFARCRHGGSEVQCSRANPPRADNKDNGAPGLRPEYHEGYYGAHVFDPDGNNVEAVHHTVPPDRTHDEQRTR